MKPGRFANSPTVRRAELPVLKLRHGSFKRVSQPIDAREEERTVFDHPFESLKAHVSPDGRVHVRWWNEGVFYAVIGHCGRAYMEAKGHQSPAEFDVLLPRRYSAVISLVSPDTPSALQYRLRSA